MKLSIIVPVYNLENYIATTLDSLLSIHFCEDYEILVINDGSKDRSEEIIHQYQQGHSNIHLLTIENQGVSHARNFGIQNAIGQYITFVDGDDTVEPDFYEKAVQELDSGRYDFVQGNYAVISEGKVSYIQHVDQDTEINDYQKMMNLFYCPGQKKIHNNVWGKVFRAEVVRGVSFDESLAVSEDQKYVFDILCTARRIKLLSAQCINYFQRDSSAIHVFSTDKEFDKLAVLEYCRSKISSLEILTFIQCRQMKILQGLYWHYTKIRDIKADEVRKEMLTLYSKDILPFMDIKTKMILEMLRYTRFALDMYIRR